jgi:hypothetical protein
MQSQTDAKMFILRYIDDDADDDELLIDNEVSIPKFFLPRFSIEMRNYPHDDISIAKEMLTPILYNNEYYVICDCKGSQVFNEQNKWVIPKCNAIKLEQPKHCDSLQLLTYIKEHGKNNNAYNIFFEHNDVSRLVESKLLRNTYHHE